MGNPFEYIRLMFIFFAPLFAVALIIYWKRFVIWKKFIFGAALLGVFMYILEYPALNMEAWSYNISNTIGITPFSDKAVIETLIWSILLVGFLSMVLIVLIPKVEKNIPFFVPRFVMSRIKSKRIKDFLGRYF